MCKSAFTHINLVGGDAKISENAIHGGGFEEFEVLFGELEIVVYQGESGVLWYSGECVFVLIEGNELAFAGEFVEYGSAMAATAKGNIHIGAVWVGYQGVHAGVEKDGVVIVVHTQTVGQRPDALLNLGCVVDETFVPTETFQRNPR